MFAPQTLLTSTVASFENPSIHFDEAEASVTPELIFVSPSIAPEHEPEGGITGPSLHDSEARDSVGHAPEGQDGRELEDLMDLWMVEKMRTASSTFSSLVSDLWRNRFGFGVTSSSTFTTSGAWRDVPRRISSWVGGTSCNWLGVCDIGIAVSGNRNAKQSDRPWAAGKSRPSDWIGDGRVLGEIPSYVHEHAPYVHLFSKEKYWPSDMAVHLDHITPRLNYTPILPSSEHPTLMDLDELNQWEQGLNVFLTSNDDVEKDPDWLQSRVNIPQPLPGDDDYKTPQAGAHVEECDSDLFDDSTPHGEGIDSAEASASDTDLDTEPKENVTCWPRRRPTRGKPGKSKAPAVLIVVDKGEGTVDAFWFYFYSFNQGNEVLNIRFGNHVGDWEHTLVRFENGEPKTVFCSEHSFGEAFTYEAAEKIGKRPVVYSATGSHAMYSSPGIHDYILPFGLLHDETDRGPLWDPSLNNLAYTYDYKEDVLLASTSNPQAPTSWFYFAGKWGDKLYPLSDKRQYTFAGQYHYVNGPLGPRFKNLGRKNVCQGDDDPCLIKRVIGGDTRSYRWNGVGEGEEMGDEDYRRFFGKQPSVEEPLPLDG